MDYGSINVFKGGWDLRTGSVGCINRRKFKAGYWAKEPVTIYTELR